MERNHYSLHTNESEVKSHIYACQLPLEKNVNVLLLGEKYYTYT